MVAVNDPFMDLDYMKYLLKYDSVHKRFNGSISTKKERFLTTNMHTDVCSGAKHVRFVCRRMAKSTWLSMDFQCEFSTKKILLPSLGGPLVQIMSANQQACSATRPTAHDRF